MARKFCIGIDEESLHAPISLKRCYRRRKNAERKCAAIKRRGVRCHVVERKG